MFARWQINFLLLLSVVRISLPFSRSLLDQLFSTGLRSTAET